MTHRCPDHITFMPIQYRIARALEPGWETVNGYAFVLPKPFQGLRFCARCRGKEWVIDHYDSGLGVIGPVMGVFEERKRVIAYIKKWQRDERSRARVVRWLLSWLRHNRRKKTFGQGMRDAGYGWCLKEAGL